LHSTTTRVVLLCALLLAAVSGANCAELFRQLSSAKVSLPPGGLDHIVNLNGLLFTFSPEVTLGSPNSDIWRSADGGLSWQKVGAGPFLPRGGGYGAVTWQKNAQTAPRIVLFGGYIGNAPGNAWGFDPKAWSSATGSALSSDWETSMFTPPSCGNLYRCPIRCDSMVLVSARLAADPANMGVYMIEGGYYGEWNNGVMFHTGVPGTNWQYAVGPQSRPWEWTRTAAGVAIDDGARVVLAGGEVLNGQNSRGSAQVWISNLGLTQWTRLTDLSVGRIGTTLHYVNSNLWLMAGSTGPSLLNDVWVSPDLGVSWMQVTNSAPWSPRWIINSVVVGSQIVVHSGICGGNNLCTDTWTAAV